MKALIIILSATVIQFGYCQPSFNKKFDIALPDTLSNAISAWGDLDNDGLLDIVLVAKGSSGKSFALYIKGDTINAPKLSGQLFEAMDADRLWLIDYDFDNQLDLIMTGKKSGTNASSIFLNKGNFSFEEIPSPFPGFSIANFSDLNDDGRTDLVISGNNDGNDFLNIFQKQADNSWKLVHDSLQINATALEVLDADNDGDTDIFLSGSSGSNFFTGILINKGKFYLTKYLSSNDKGIAALGDLNQDGTFDVLWAGTNQSGIPNAKTYQSNSKQFDVTNTPVLQNAFKLFGADFNSDGVLDVSYQTTSDLDTLNIIQYNGTGASENLEAQNLHDQHYGDFDNDGDLDILQLVIAGVPHLVIYENQTVQKNKFPDTPFNAIAIPIYNHLFMYWMKPDDDLTPQASLTYDLLLQGSTLNQSSNFDLIKATRLIASNGNNGTHNFHLYNHFTFNGSVDFAIQSIDNSLYGGKGICFGTSSTCATVSQETVQVCTKQEINISAPSSETLWFSFSAGYLGTMNAYTFQPEARDTVFYFDPAQPGCAALKLFMINIANDTTKIENLKTYACENASLHLEAENGWAVLSWQSFNKGDLGTTQSINFSVTQPDSVFLTMKNLDGCTILRKNAILISKPNVQVENDMYKIMKGSSVQLSATGADHYFWSPSTGLNSNDIPNPVSTPASSIQYTVTGFDSLSCEDKATVTIIVEGAGFIPNLFTPNDDGKNDELKVYGLLPVNNFTLNIYNREGNLVFKTSSLTEATQQGWDGTYNGIKQPSGVYFWKVKGSMASGERILLNGKDSGSIVLVR